MSGRPALLEAALAYAARGWPVFPCREKPGEPYTNKRGDLVIPEPKSPYWHPSDLKNGVKDATTDPATIRRWWGRWPGAAIGLDCGGAGLYVIDCDVKSGADGIGAFEALGIVHTEALHARTPSGGLHIVYKHTGAQLGNTAGSLAPGIDTRGAGGYILLPPSQLVAGTYAALDDWQREPAPLPGALRALLEKTPRPAPPAAAPARHNNGGGYGAAALAAECERVARAMEGTRNETLNRAAFSLGQLIAGGELEAGTVRAELLRAALAAGLSESEAQKTLESGLDGGLGSPRQRPITSHYHTEHGGARDTAPLESEAPLEVEGEAPLESEAALFADIERGIESAKQERGAARDRALEGLLPLLLRAPALAQARYKRALAQALPEIGARDLERLLKGAQARERRNGNGARYTIAEGCHCAVRYAGGEVYTEPLCNFTAEVLEDVARDNGTGAPDRALMVRGTLEDGAPLPAGAVDVGKFAALGWVNELWGVRAIIRAGRDTKDRLREAIQLHSNGVTHRHIYTHTGWREIEGRRVYLAGNGAVGGDGVTVELERELSRYRLPTEPATRETLAEAMRASLRFLEIAPLEITAPLWAAAYLAPLAEVVYPDFVLWLYGKTGTLKSTLAALALCHYGEFDDKALFSWGDTANRLEMNCFLLKDALTVIDDFAPQSDPFKAREMERNAAQIVRNVGNQAGRGRLNRNLSMATTYRPRGLVVSTGEQAPSTESILARIYTLELHPGDVDLERLTASQQEAGQYPRAMAGYLAFLAEQWGDLQDGAPAYLRDLRDQARVDLNNRHLRLPGALAHLFLGFTQGVEFAVAVGALAKAEAESLKARAWEALKAGSEAQALRVERERPTLRFLEVFLGLLDQGKARLNHRDEKVAAHIGGGAAGEELLGWYDAESLYLLGGPTYNRVARYLRDEGAHFPVKEATLRKYLVEEGVLLPAGDGHNTDVIRVGGETRRALCLSRARVAELVGDLPQERGG